MNRNIWFSVTFKNDDRVLNKAIELHHRLVEEMKADSPDGDFGTQCFFQPLPSVIGKHGVERGGNLLMSTGKQITPLFSSAHLLSMTNCRKLSDVRK